MNINIFENEIRKTLQISINIFIIQKCTSLNDDPTVEKYYEFDINFMCTEKQYSTNIPLPKYVR